MPRDAAGPIYIYTAEAALSGLSDGDVQRLVDVHRRAPFGPHPDDLARVLNIFRAQATTGKYLIIALPGELGYRLAKVSGKREQGSIELEPDMYRSIEDAEHAVFVARMRESGLGDGTGATL